MAWSTQQQLSTAEVCRYFGLDVSGLATSILDWCALQGCSPTTNKTKNYNRNNNSNNDNDIHGRLASPLEVNSRQCYPAMCVVPLPTNA